MTKTHQQKIEAYNATIQRLRDKHWIEKDARLTAQIEQRFMERGAILEEFIEGAELLTDEQIYKFLRYVLRSESAIEVLHYIVDPTQFTRTPDGMRVIIEIDEDEDEANDFDPNDTELV